MGYEPKWLKAIRKTKGGARVIAKHQKPRGENEGERLPDFIHESGGDYFRLDVAKPMAYVKCVQVAREGHRMDIQTDSCDLCGASRQAIVASDPLLECRPTTLWYCDPLGHWGHVDVTRFSEEEDGTVTIHGVIENAGPYHPHWRGTLTKGLWEGIGVTVE